MLTSDNDQIQMVKDFWKKYGKPTLIMVVILSVISFGWGYYQRYKTSRINRASMSYTQMLISIEQQKNDEAKLHANNLIKNYAKSPYASLAAFMQAKLAVNALDLTAAQKYLRFVIDNSSNKTLRQIAKIRLARILLAIKQPKEALELLNAVDDKSYTTEINELLGDVMLMLGKRTEAKQNYQKAKGAATDSSPISPLLKSKMQQV